MKLGRNRRGNIASRYRPWRMFVLVALCLVSSRWSVLAGPEFSDPYKILGVSRRASNAEIKKSYRKLCLIYHPDKNVQKTEREKSISERKFKQIREAYDAILNKKSFGLGANNGYYGGVPMPEDYFSTILRNAWFLLSRPDHFFNEMKKLNLFATGSPIATRGQRNPAFLNFKSIYLETIEVPLEELYKGVPSFRLSLKDNLWKRYKASIRGKFFFFSLYQAIAFAFPILEKSRIIGGLIGLYIIHGTTPMPDPKAAYYTIIPRGTKGGEQTVRFAEWDQLEVIFQIQEAEHSLYRRVDNNLHAQLLLTRKEAKRGCIKRLKALDPFEEAIEIRIPAKKFSYKKEQQFLQRQKQQGTQQEKTKKQNGKYSRVYDNTIRIPGKGWPTRKRTKANIDLYSHGDLIVTIKVKPPSKKNKNEKNEKGRFRILSFLSSG